MGGVLILFAVVVATLLWTDLTNRYVWLAVFAMISFGAVGFWDDYLKTVRGRNQGLTALQKIVAQAVVALGIGVLFYSLPAYSTKLSVPFFKAFSPDIGLFYIPFAVLVIVGASNAVNLTDGLDGLAIGPVMVAAMAYTVVAYISGHKVFADHLLIPYIEGSGELAIFTGSILGASLGFLWFNTYPASVFMGDVGSLPLGAALGTVAVISKHELLLLLVGGVFVIEALSVIFQVVSYKSRGKRVFLMAPIHHHFELKGWEEPKVVVRLWIIAMLLALVSLSTLKLR
jgi:phospho-N-acetylmuramoyl-pentapeptide-transferase